MSDRLTPHREGEIAARNAIRQSYRGLIAQAEQDRDPEGAAHLQHRLRDREAQWKREDEEAGR